MWTIFDVLVFIAGFAASSPKCCISAALASIARCGNVASPVAALVSTAPSPTFGF